MWWGCESGRLDESRVGGCGGGGTGVGGNRCGGCVGSEVCCGGCVGGVCPSCRGGGCGSSCGGGVGAENCFCNRCCGGAWAGCCCSVHFIVGRCGVNGLGKSLSDKSVGSALYN